LLEQEIPQIKQSPTDRDPHDQLL